MSDGWYLREVRATRPVLDESSGAIVATPDSHGIVVGTGLSDGVLVFWTGAERATVTPPDAITRWRQPDAGTGDVWGAIIAELPEGAAKEAAIARRELGIARYGVPLGLRDLETTRRDRREEQADTCGYSAAEAALLCAAGDDDASDVAAYVAAQALIRASGDWNAQVGFAIGRAVRKLARGAR